MNIYANKSWADILPTIGTHVYNQLFMQLSGIFCTKVYLLGN